MGYWDHMFPKAPTTPGLCFPIIPESRAFLHRQGFQRLVFLLTTSMASYFEEIQRPLQVFVTGRWSH
ncbi:hypothetical protein N7460_001587 [Penicillium canescens]|uniref:Uncharacterized protein n=1 Tax=Penicillium canescens TaxID=5083 RepID=A0AAD6IIV9_PENCN|nr:hypothetical protein N7460_001587 [Penicillium canescens]